MLNSKEYLELKTLLSQEFNTKEDIERCKSLIELIDDSVIDFHLALEDTDLWYEEDIQFKEII